MDIIHDMKNRNRSFAHKAETEGERVLVESCEPNWKIEFFFSWFCKTRTQNTMKKALRRKNEVELMSAQTMNQLNLIRCLRA